MPQSPELCWACKGSGRINCRFRTEAEKIARDKHKPAGEKHINIADLRIQARSRGCPQLNDIDPEYPGKENL